MRAALPTEGAGRPGQLTSARALQSALQDLQGWLQQAGVPRLAQVDINPILSALRAFGFHLAAVDIRQNSAYHDKALAQLMGLAGIEESDSYPEWRRDRRRGFSMPSSTPGGRSFALWTSTGPKPGRLSTSIRISRRTSSATASTASAR